MPAPGSGDTGHPLCCVCAEPLCPPVQPFGQILMAFRQLEMVNTGGIDLYVLNVTWLHFLALLS